MDEDSLSSLGTLLLIIAVQAVVALDYASIANSRQTHLRELAEAGNRRAQRVLKLHDHPTRLRTTYQLTQMLLRFAIVAVAILGIAQPLSVSINATTPAFSPLIVYLLVLVPIACLTLILGDLVPSAIGSSHANSLALWSVYPMQWLILFLSPLVLLMLAVSRSLSGVFGSSKRITTVTEEEIMTMVDAGQRGGSIEHEEKEMIYSVLELNETLAREVMVPRIDVVAMEITTPIDKALEAFIESGYSRIPVYEETIDNIKGLLYAKDLLKLLRNHNRSDKSIADLLRPAYFVPETRRADALLKELQEREIHIAMVVDEYGGTAGLVTIEDLIEEIVGDIKDEFDVNEEDEFVQHGPDEFVVDAGIDLDDFNDLLSVDLPTDESDTLGGFLYSRLGRVHEVGETVTDDEHHLSMRIESIEGRRIRKVRITRKNEADRSDAAVEGQDGQTTQQIIDQSR